MTNQTLAWVAFNLFVVAMLALDLGVFHRKAHEISFKEAIGWSCFWITLALIFNAGIYYFRGEEAGTAFLAGYLIEKSLSVDNIFVFLMIFSYFKIPSIFQHKILFWGIIGALVMRAIFIFAGISLIKNFHWVIYLFGAFLIFTAIKMVRDHGQEIDLEKNRFLQAFRRIVPTLAVCDSGKFFVTQGSQRFATPLFAALVVVEISDVIFAVDSIPAILAISDDPFIVFTSNVFAILGLRSLYFAVAGFAQMFAYLHYGLAAILAFVGTKMLISDFYKVPIAAALGIVLFFLVISIVWSIVAERRQKSISG